MLFPFLAVSAIAVAFIQLGSLSVWVTVLSLTVKLMLLVAIVLALIVAWRRYKQD